MANRNRNAFCSFCRKSYQDVGPLVEGPGKVYICSECIELCESIVKQEMRRRAGPFRYCLPVLELLEERLKQFVGNQKELARDLAAAAYAHYDRSTTNHEEAGAASSDRGAVLLIGLSHSATLFLARGLAFVLDVPFAQVDGNELTKATTEPDESPLYKLFQDCDFDLEAAQRGLVFVDNIDRPCGQQPFLELLTAHAREPVPNLRIETDGILFVCSGEFAGLDDIIGRRGRHAEQPITSDDLIAFGMPAALANRFQCIFRIEPLDEGTIQRLVSFADLAIFVNEVK